MKKRIFLIAILLIIFGVLLSQKTYAKYVLSDSLSMKVYIDKTPPIISVTSDGKKEDFDKSQTDLVKRTNDVTIDTTDNIKIDYNEVYYNPTTNNFDGKTPTRFDNGKQLTDEGYYKVVAVDTSGNKTEIIILLDKSAPNVTVKFYKKGEVSSLNRSVLDITRNGGANLCV